MGNFELDLASCLFYKFITVFAVGDENCAGPLSPQAFCILVSFAAGEKKVGVLFGEGSFI